VFNEQINTNGYIQVAPDGKANIPILISGWVQNMNWYVGKEVKKGEVLFRLSSNELVDLQKEYAMSLSNLKQYQLELERMKSLMSAKIGAKKDLQQTERNYKVALAENAALKARFSQLNVSLEKAAENEFVHSIPIVAPLNGFIVALDLVNGAYIHPEQQVMEIIDPEKLQLNVNVFEKDLHTMSIGQKVLFYDPDRKTEKYTATLISLGKTIHPESKTITCIAGIDDAFIDNMIQGMFVETCIITCERDGLALPSESIIKEDYGNFVLVNTSEENDRYRFEKVAIEIGREDVDFTEVMTLGLKDVLVSGLYHLNQQE